MNSDLPFSGLTDAQAVARRIHFGPNELPQSKRESFWLRSYKLLKEPMLLLLIAAAIIYMVMGDLGESILLLASVFVVVGISLYQDRKAENALAALKELSSPRALVIRDGSEKRIAATDLVPGDLIVLHEGDRVPGDGVILQTSHLRVDESLLTGESFSIRKSQQPNEVSEDPFDTVKSQSKVFSSTLVVGGTAYVRILKTGIHTEVGKIGKTLQESGPEGLSLNREIRQMVRIFAWIGAFICSVIILLYGLTHGEWMQAVLIGLATEMALLPEEFPVILTIFLAMGAWRLSKVQVLIRRPSAIERLGSVTVLCVDKTGTLTENRMTVAQLNNSRVSIEVDSKSAEMLPEEFHEAAEFGVLASHRDPFDPMEKAIRRLVESGGWGREHLHDDWQPIKDYPLSEKLLAMSCVWKDPRSDSYIIAAKGAPEAVIDLCHMDQNQTQSILEAVRNMARQGLRVLGVARASFFKAQLPHDQHEFAFQWVGLIGLQDPLRAGVAEAVQLCRGAGIRVIMMTGDYPETALKIAAQAGLETANSLMTGTELASLPDHALHERLRTAHIFARMVPDQKLRIVKALKELGHVVAMTGDGVNDAPSLKWADVGIAMGARGTDVARESSDIVLLDDNFSSIVLGIQRGRLIFDNIKKAMSYIVSIHVPIAGLSLVPVLFNWPLILFPIHIVFLELIIDPACSLMFESQEAEGGLMGQPPRPLTARLFTMGDVLQSVLQGLFIFGLAAATYLNHSEDPSRARTLAFMVLTLSNTGLIFADMSGGSIRQLSLLFKRKSNAWIVLTIILVLVGITQLPKVRSLFHFGQISGPEFFVAMVSAFCASIFLGIWNRAAKKRNSTQPM
jgi:P-type Ca2+ transporter type 2C